MPNDSKAPRPKTKPSSLTTEILDTAASTKPTAAKINAGEIREPAVSETDLRAASFLPNIFRLSI